MKWSNIAGLFYGNWFYGLCACSLMYETMARFHLKPLPFKYWAFIAAATILYYTIAYIFSIPSTWQLQQNTRLLWYSNHKNIVYAQIVLCIVAIVPVCIAILQQISVLYKHAEYTLLAMAFPLIGFLYYGSFLKITKRLQIRNWGFAKPFIVGAVWAGIVTIYPIVFAIVQQQQIVIPNWLLLHYFIKNTMYISLLCILFDMKDYISDYNQRIQTFVVQLGMEKTIQFIIVPLSFVGCLVSVAMLYHQQFSISAITINSIAFIMLWWVLYIFNVKKSIAFYLVVIDGLMLVKAITGIISYKI